MSVNDMNLFDLQQHVAKCPLGSCSQADMEVEPNICESSFFIDEEDADFFDVNAESMTKGLGWNLTEKENVRYRYNFQVGLIIRQEELKSKHKSQKFEGDV